MGPTMRQTLTLQLVQKNWALLQEVSSHSPLGRGASAGPMEFLGLEPPFRGSYTKGEQGTGRQNWHMINFISTRMAFCFVLCIFFLPKVFLKTHSKRT